MVRDFTVAIPARWGSSRLPGKPLALIGPWPLVRHVYERARRSGAGRVLVATDDQRILEAVSAFGGEAVLTDPHCPSGTDRVAQALASQPPGVVVNVQGDEPFMDPQLIRQVAEALFTEDPPHMATAAHGITDAEACASPHVVKVVLNLRHEALYFSRAPIPWDRDGPREEVLRHVGIYGYRPGFLQAFARMAPTPLEMREKLEQLRALENGCRVAVVRAGVPAPGV
ncbi:MAG: 3-deoxy-manno-octulosonate cytidylyltransferase, partial [Magnetococcus sp. WYHC-3]